MLDHLYSIEIPQQILALTLLDPPARPNVSRLILAPYPTRSVTNLRKTFAAYGTVLLSEQRYLTCENLILMLYPSERNVKFCLIVDVVPSDWSNLAVRTNEIFYWSDCVWEAYVLECKHVTNKPVIDESLSVILGRRTFNLLRFLFHMREENLK